MKIQIKNLEPNPYRDMNNYPMDEAKIKSLTESIQQTGFWDNILSRERNGKFQIAYGHHRLAALREVMKPTDEVDIPVKELDDATMIKIMANENMEAWSASVRIIDETIKVTNKFIDEHPESLLISRKPAEYSKRASEIANFLGWKEKTVFYSLERLQMISDKTLDKEAIEKMTSDTAARDFVRAVKKVELPLHKQRAAVEIILDAKRGERDIEAAVIGEKYTTPKKRQEYQDEKTIKIETHCAGIRNKASELLDDLRDLVRLEKELGTYAWGIHRKLLDMSLTSLSKQIELIIKKPDNEKETESAGPNPASIEG